MLLGLLAAAFTLGSYVFVADNRERAVYYARPATAHAMTPCTFDRYWPLEHDLRAPPVGEPVALIVSAQVPARRLKDDPYDPEKEPGQYRVYRGITREWIVGFEEVEFPELRDPGERSLMVAL